MDLESRDQRYDLYRIRSNLCELPTTYIANNCQVDLSNGLTDVMDYLEKRPTNNKGVEWRDGGGAVVGGGGGGGGIMSGARPNNKAAKPGGGRYGRGLSCFEKSPLKNVVHITNLEPQSRGGGEVAGAVERRRATYNNCCDTRYTKKNVKRLLKSLSQRESQFCWQNHFNGKHVLANFCVTNYILINRR